MIFIAFITITILIVLDIIITSYRSRGEKSDVIVVLGCNLDSFFMSQRIEKTIELYKNNIAQHIIVTGKGRGEITEALGMKEKLIALGIPSEYIYVEEKAINTYDNLKFSKNIMDINNFKSAVIVSDGYHLARIKMICRNIKLKATFEGRNCSYYGRYEVFAIIREIPAYIKDLIISFVHTK
ncbi:YdcF family protein [Clostridium sardiniense]|uniref:YdcF family protein n=1 Tax=Clostridium sardiniense TaxID=29369 RepID=A0ABS7KYZ9_CLOSR|nr:YdcF family protein [Clostridium sardiniense]MBY0756040.1 YdcF family protein [Clostridium sardiniense]MDQ0460670.1 uncharacterized SAM-binding protein YcdF (DUF218 family) [Clostridium sardiniense]